MQARVLSALEHAWRRVLRQSSIRFRGIHLTSAQLLLWRKIESFDIDGGGCALPFAARLAREHGWRRSYADRVVLEYKRFVFLAHGSIVPRCPSEHVDAAWHLHLTYTRSYWQRFCGEVLGSPFHHEPTRGGPREAEKHRAMYGDTLTAYRETFGHEPPADIWPSVERRFGDDIRQRMVNTARNWIVPKHAVRRVLLFAAAFLVTAVLLPGCNGGINPFELKGPAFLYFLIPAMVAAIVLGLVVRFLLCRPGPEPADDNVNLTWEKAAYLAGGYPRLTAAAIARLAETDIVRVDGKRLERGSVVARNPSPVENVILDHLPIAAWHWKSVQKAVAFEFDDQVAKLREKGLVLTLSQRVQAGLAALLPLAIVVLGFGVPRLIMGLSARKPVAFLVLTLVFGSILGLIICLSGLHHRSRRGQHVLKRMRDHTEPDKSEAGLAVALFGTTILAGSTLAYLNDWLPRPTATGGDGGGSTGCGGGGGGCGGGGCGGCGGG